MTSELLALSKVCELITIIKKQKSQKLTSNWSNYNRTRLTFKAGTHEGSCSWNTLPGKYPNQYRRRTRRGSWMMKRPDWGMVTSCSKKNKPVWLANLRHIMSRQANFSTNQGACSWNRLVQQICPWNLLPHIKPARNRWCRRGSFTPGACCMRKLHRVYHVWLWILIIIISVIFKF